MKARGTAALALLAVISSVCLGATAGAAPARPGSATGTAGTGATAGSTAAAQVVDRYAPGTRTARAKTMGTIEVTGTVTLDNVVVDSIRVHAGGRLVATNVMVRGSVVVLPKVGAAITKVHLTDVGIANGMVVNAIDAAGNLAWGTHVPVDLVVRDGFIYHPQGPNGSPVHTEALAAFGWPKGAKFIRTAFVQAGPNNGTATATINWHGADTTFDRCVFLWRGAPAAYYATYIEGPRNVVRNSFFSPGSGYDYPNSSPRATFVGSRRLGDGAAIKP